MKVGVGERRSSVDVEPNTSRCRVPRYFLPYMYGVLWYLALSLFVHVLSFFVFRAFELGSESEGHFLIRSTPLSLSLSVEYPPTHSIQSKSLQRPLRILTLNIPTDHPSTSTCT